MIEPTERSDAFIDLKVDASLYKLAAIFGSVAFPEGMPDYQKIAIFEAAERERNAEGSPGIENRMQPDEKEKREARSRDNLDYLISIVEDSRERQREHERQWTAASHSYAGQTLTGEEWKRMMNWFADDKNVAQWEDAMMAETGQARDEVRRTGGKMKRFYDLMQEDAKGTLSDEERREFETLGNNADVRRGVEVQEKIQGIRVEAGHDHTGLTDHRLDGCK